MLVVPYAAYLVVAFCRRRISQRYRTHMVPPDRRTIRRFIHTSVPIGGEWVIGMLSFAVFSTIIARMGDTSMAASQAFLILLSLSFMQAVGVSVAAATLVGRYIGAGDLEAANRSFWSAQRMAAVLGLVVAALFVSVPELLIRVFTNDPEVIALGRPLLMLGAGFQFFDALGIVAGGALRGAGDTRWPFFVHTGFAWAFFVPLAYWLGVILEGGLWGAWVGGTIYVILLSVVFVLRFRSRAWERLQI